jgi:hypothetical protein
LVKGERLAELLSYPGRSGMGRDVEMHNPPFSAAVRPEPDRQ